MTWVDLLLLVAVVGLIVSAAQQEAGHSFLDAAMTVMAAFLARISAAPVTAALGWPAAGGASGASPAVFALVFVVVWAIGLHLSRTIHRYGRWSMDTFDCVFGAVFGLVTGLVVGHVLTESAAGMAILTHGSLPDYFQHSYLAEELRSFKTCHYVL